MSAVTNNQIVTDGESVVTDSQSDVTDSDRGSSKDGQTCECSEVRGGRGTLLKSVALGTFRSTLVVCGDPCDTSLSENGLRWVPIFDLAENG